jgi:L-fucose isomerase-like protein
MRLPTPPRVRFVLLGHADYQNDLGVQMARASAHRLAEAGLDCGTIGEAAVTKDAAIAAARAALREDPDAVILYVGTWLEAPVAIAALREVEHLPVAVWAFPMFDTPQGRESTGSFVAQLVLKGTLKRMDRQACWLTGLPEEEPALRDAVAFARAAAAVRALRETTLGLVGYASMGMYTGTVDPVILRAVLGPDLDHVDTYTLVRRAESLTEDEVSEETDRVATCCRVGEAVDNDSLRKSARLSVALRQLATERGWQAANVKCQYELSQEYGMTACVAVSMLAQSGVATGCEGDVPCTAAQAMLAQFTTEPVWYADVLDFDDDSVLLSPCGFAPPSLAAPGTQACLGRFAHPGFKGVHVSAQPKSGTVTLAQLCPLHDSFTLLTAVAEGEQCDLRQGWAPALRARFANGTQTFVDSLTSQHVAVAYGNHARELEWIARLLGIQALAAGQAAGGRA